jgi:zinc protease
MTAAAARHVSIALCLLTLLSAAACEKKPAAFTLDNGLRVDLLPAPHGDRAALVVLFGVGAEHDPPGRSGMAHVVEHLLSSSTSTRPARTLAPTVAARAGDDYTMYASEVVGGRIMEEIDDVALRLTAQPVTDAELMRARKQVLDEIASGLRGGVAADIAAITPAEVDDFRAHYGAATARLIVTGRFNLADAERHVRAAFGALPAGKPPQARAAAAGPRVTATEIAGDGPKAVALAVAAPDVKDPLYPAFLVLAARLAAAGAGGGGAHGWKLDFAPLARPALFVTSPIPAGQQPEAVAARVRGELAAIVGAPLAPGEPARALARFGADLGLTPASTPRDTAFAAGRLRQLGVDAQALERGVSAVTQDQLAAAARRFDAPSP